jgi:hypothetical protein
MRTNTQDFFNENAPEYAAHLKTLSDEKFAIAYRQFALNFEKTTSRTDPRYEKLRKTNNASADECDILFHKIGDLEKTVEAMKLQKLDDFIEEQKQKVRKNRTKFAGLATGFLNKKKK